MNYTSAKKSGLKFSSIGLGTNAVGGHNLFDNLKDENGIALVEKALELGITFIDTADAYGHGKSETLVGQVLREKRDQVVLATKGAIQNLPNGESTINNNPDYLKEALNESLKRLGTDYVDLYYIHYPDDKTPLDEAVSALNDLKKEGKIKSIGISNVTLDQLKEANSDGYIDFVQIRYNMLQRDAEKDILPYCVENNISFVPYGPLAFGLLAGKYDANMKLTPGDWRNDLDLFEGDLFKKNLAIVDKLKVIANRRGVELTNLVLAWLLHQDGIDVVIPGAKTADQVAINAKASDIELSDKELQEINNIIA